VPIALPASTALNATSDATSVAVAAPASATHAGVKRKLNEDENAAADHEAFPVEDDDSARELKLRKLDAVPDADKHNLGSPLRKADLPFSIWKQVFNHLSPAMLARCVRVSKTFHSFLVYKDGQSNGNTPQDAKSSARPTKKEIDTIWTQSKRAVFPTLPKSLQGMTDLEMFALIGASSCQSCDKVGAPSTATSIFNAGPGADGIRVIWPFRVRLCGSCLERNVAKVGHGRNSVDFPT
jgi:hypothetical protein